MEFWFLLEILATDEFHQQRLALMKLVETGILQQRLALTVEFWFLVVLVKAAEIHRILTMAVAVVEFYILPVAKVVEVHQILIIVAMEAMIGTELL